MKLLLLSVVLVMLVMLLSLSLFARYHVSH